MGDLTEIIYYLNHHRNRVPERNVFWLHSKILWWLLLILRQRSSWSNRLISDTVSRIISCMLLDEVPGVISNWWGSIRWSNSISQTRILLDSLFHRSLSLCFFIKKEIKIISLHFYCVLKIFYKYRFFCYFYNESFFLSPVVVVRYVPKLYAYLSNVLY